MQRLILPLFEPEQAKNALGYVYRAAKPHLVAGRRLQIEVREEKRSDEQNRRMWAMLSDVSRQVDWYGRKLTAEDWKHVFSSSLRKLDVVPNLDGTGFVALGLSTSQMTKAEMSDLMELMAAFGAEKGVQWTDPNRTSFDETGYGSAAPASRSARAMDTGPTRHGLNGY